MMIVMVGLVKAGRKYLIIIRVDRTACIRAGWVHWSKADLNSGHVDVLNGSELVYRRVGGCHVGKIRLTSFKFKENFRKI